jgi:hypothetical protein
VLCLLTPVEIAMSYSGRDTNKVSEPTEKDFVLGLHDSATHHAKGANFIFEVALAMLLAKKAMKR